MIQAGNVLAFPDGRATPIVSGFMSPDGAAPAPGEDDIGKAKSALVNGLVQSAEHLGEALDQVAAKIEKLAPSDESRELRIQHASIFLNLCTIHKLIEDISTELGLS